MTSSAVKHFYDGPGNTYKGRISILKKPVKTVVFIFLGKVEKG